VAPAISHQIGTPRLLLRNGALGFRSEHNLAKIIKDLLRNTIALHMEDELDPWCHVGEALVKLTKGGVYNQRHEGPVGNQEEEDLFLGKV
jgi:hypothetical protein